MKRRDDIQTRRLIRKKAREQIEESNSMSESLLQQLRGHQDLNYPETNLDKKKTCLIAAQAAVCGDRPLNYGNPENNFGRIAILWNAWNAVRRPGPYVGADIAIMMDLVKTARLANNPAHNDSWIDKAGYAACGYDIAAKDDK